MLHKILEQDDPRWFDAERDTKQKMYIYTKYVIQTSFIECAHVMKFIPFSYCNIYQVILTLSD